jgi:hypothetical protein
MILTALAGSFLTKKQEIDPELKRLAERYVDGVARGAHNVDGVTRGTQIPERARKKLYANASVFCQEYVDLWKKRKGKGIGKDEDSDFSITDGLITPNNPFMRGGLGLLDAFYARQLSGNPKYNFDSSYAALIDRSRQHMDACAIELLRWRGPNVKRIGTEGFGILIGNRVFDHRSMGRHQANARAKLFDLARNLDNYCKQRFPELVEDAAVPQTESAVAKDWKKSVTRENDDTTRTGDDKGRG